MNYSFTERRRREMRRKSAVSFLLFLFILASLIFFIYKFFSYDPSKPVDLSLEESVLNSLKDVKGTYAIAVKDLKTGESYQNNEEKVFEAGSLYKLWVMAETFKQVEEGLFKEDDPLTADIEALNREFNIASDEAELTEGVSNFTIASALHQMITISHNYAALALTKKIKLSEVSGFLKDNGFDNSQVGENGNPPKTSAKDIMNFYEKLYKKELANENNTKKMIELLKKQLLNDGLPKYLPQPSEVFPSPSAGENIMLPAVAHKTGDIGWFKHDAGIVFTEKGDYIIVVLSESESPLGAQERIAALSKAVYDYFTR